MEIEHTVEAPANVSEASIAAVVIRCGCAARGLDPFEVHIPDPCPHPLRIEPRGVVSYYSRNPFKMLLWGIKQGWREGKQR